MVMNMRRKGQATFLIYALPIIIGIGAIAYLGTTVQQLIDVMIKNYWVLLGGIVAVALTSVIVSNTVSDSPRWREDLIGVGVIIILIVLVSQGAFALQGTSKYQADISVGVNNEPYGPITLESVDVSNIEAMSTSPGSLSTFALLADEITAEMKVDCYVEDDSGIIGRDMKWERIDTKTFTINVIEGSMSSKTKKVKGLHGEECRANVWITGTDEIDQSEDRKTETFELPR